MHRLVSRLAIAALTIGAVACNKEPTTELIDAAAAIDAARVANAPMYAAGIWARADSVRMLLDAEVEAQRAKLGALRSFRLARQYAAEAKSLADSATSESAAAYERERAEVEAGIAMVRLAASELDSTLASLPPNVRRGLDVQTALQDIASLRAEAAGADSAIAANRVADARLTVESAQARMDSLKARVAGLTPRRRT